MAEEKFYSLYFYIDTEDNTLVVSKFPLTEINQLKKIMSSCVSSIDEASLILKCILSGYSCDKINPSIRIDERLESVLNQPLENERFEYNDELDDNGHKDELDDERSFILQDFPKNVQSFLKDAQIDMSVN